MKNKLKSCAILATLGAITIHLINKTLIEMATKDSLLNSSEGNYYDWRFGKIYYRKQGNGKPLLLLHDLDAESSGVEWKKVAAILAEKHTVYTVDLLGCGRSEKPNITYTNFLYVQMLTDFIKHIIGEKADVVATGESAAIAAVSYTHLDVYKRQELLLCCSVCVRNICFRHFLLHGCQDVLPVHHQG